MRPILLHNLLSCRAHFVCDTGSFLSTALFRDPTLHIVAGPLSCIRIEICARRPRRSQAASPRCPQTLQTPTRSYSIHGNKVVVRILGFEGKGSGTPTIPLHVPLLRHSRC